MSEETRRRRVSERSTARMVLQGNLAPRGRGGGQRAVRPVTPRSFSEGARADGRERGAGGGCAVSLYG